MLVMSFFVAEVRKILVVDRGESKEEMFLHFYIVDPIVCREHREVVGKYRCLCYY